MDMSISSSTTLPISRPVANLAKGIDRKAADNLRDSLKSGDMEGAKQAYSTLTRNVPAAVLSNPNTALSQLGTALQSGDVAGAQQALGDFAKNLHAYRTSGSLPVSGGPVSLPEPVQSTTGGTAGTLINAVACRADLPAPALSPASGRGSAVQAATAPYSSIRSKFR
jgi:hypothetical protein